MIEIAPRISVDPGIMSGKPVITGTRVPVDVVVGHVAAGDSHEAIASSFRIKPEDILAALQYASRVLSEERVYLPT